MKNSDGVLQNANSNLSRLKNMKVDNKSNSWTQIYANLNQGYQFKKSFYMIYIDESLPLRIQFNFIDIYGILYLSPGVHALF